jgi:hypothetical protein
MNHPDVFLFYFILLIHKPWKICIILSFRKEDVKSVPKTFSCSSYEPKSHLKINAPGVRSCLPWKFTGKNQSRVHSE